METFCWPWRKSWESISPRWLRSPGASPNTPRESPTRRSTAGRRPLSSRHHHSTEAKRSKASPRRRRWHRPTPKGRGRISFLRRIPRRAAPAGLYGPFPGPASPSRHSPSRSAETMGRERRGDDVRWGSRPRVMSGQLRRPPTARKLQPSRWHHSPRRLHTRCPRACSYLQRRGSERSGRKGTGSTRRAPAKSRGGGRWDRGRGWGDDCRRVGSGWGIGGWKRLWWPGGGTISARGTFERGMGGLETRRWWRRGGGKRRWRSEKQCKPWAVNARERERERGDDEKDWLVVWNLSRTYDD